jgi:hypothetical protein
VCEDDNVKKIPPRGHIQTLATALAGTALVVGACGGGGANEGAVSLSPSLSHVHGAVVDSDVLLTGTHEGVFRIDPTTGQAERVGTSKDDFMAFASAGGQTLVGSGHPGADSSMPNPMGFIVSRDGAKSWEAVSLVGEVDFHGVAARGQDVIGWDTRGPILLSTDLGRTWSEGPTIAPTSIAWFGDGAWLAVPDYGLVTLDVVAQTIESAEIPAVLLAASSDGRALWRIDDDGAVHRTTDGQSWEPQGSVEAVEALGATFDEAYVVTADSVLTFNAS